MSPQANAGTGPSLDSLTRYLNGKMAIELESTKYINGSQIFAGYEPESIHHAGQQAVRQGQVTIRDGFEDLIKYLKAKHCDTTILSVNFSDDWIKGCIAPVQLDVISNTIRNGLIHGPHPDSGLILTSGHKLAAMSACRARLRDAGQTCVYIGDSETDLECMLACDKAIVMRQPDTSGEKRERLSVQGITGAGTRGAAYHRLWPGLSVCLGTRLCRDPAKLQPRSGHP